MMTDNLWIRLVDHRVSTALIFFFLLILLGGKHRKQLFGLRAAAALIVLCAASWVIRFLADAVMNGSVMQGVGYSLHLLVMGVMYLGAYTLCYQAGSAERAFSTLMAVTIYKMAWNTFKVCASATNLIDGVPLWSSYSIMGALVSYVVYAVICYPACRFYRNVVKKVPSGPTGRASLFAIVVFTLCQVLLEFCGRVFTADAAALFLYYLCALMYTTINYVGMIGFMQLANYRRDNQDMQNFIRNRMQYYQMSHEGITSLQVKCHDLKHQIAMIRSQMGKESFEQHLRRLEDSINEYGTVVDCGNETINIVLTEKNILCSTCGVKFSYIIDGTLFDFMSEMEIYSLFGNALDNALESSSKVADPARRMISLKAAARGDMVVLHVENYFEEAPRMVDGMPVTTKSGRGHGFGLRSIREIAGKYEGAAGVSAEGNIFKLTVFMRPGGKA